MKKNILLLLCIIILNSSFADELRLKKVIKFREKSYRFLDKSLIYVYTSDNKFYYYDFSKIDSITFPFPAKKKLLENDIDNNLILGLSNEEFKDFSLDYFRFYKVNINNKIMESIDNVNFKSSNQYLPKFLRDLHYVDWLLYAPIKNYCLIVKDVKGQEIYVDELHPEKHAYHDMDVVLIDKKGNDLAVMPFTFDEGTASNKDYLEVSPDGKYIKIFASSGYILGHIDESLVEKYPELSKGAFYFIYELVPDNTPYENTEVLDFRHDLKVNEEITLESEFKDYSAFNIKFNNKFKHGTINDTRVRLRTEPNLDCSTILLLEKGARVTIVDKSDIKLNIGGEGWWEKDEWYWYQVETSDGKPGWVYGKYLDIEE